MRYREIPPPAGLSDLIHCVWHLESTGPGAVQPVVPDGRVEIVIHLGEPFSELGRDGVVRRQAQVMVGGQLTHPIHLLPSDHASVVGIRLTTVGAGAVLPVEELTNRTVPLAAVTRDLGDRLLDVLSRRSSGDDHLVRVAQVVGSAPRRSPSLMVSHAQRMIETGHYQVRSLASELGTTLRTLQRRFHEEVGVSPSTMKRIVRFRRAFGLLSRTPSAPMAPVSASAGYFDQAHFIREFRRFAGASPRRFFGGNADMASALLGGEGE